MKAKVLIFDSNTSLTETPNSLKDYEYLFQTIYTTHPEEADAKALIDRPDYIIYVGRQDSEGFQAFEAKLSAHHLTKDIPIVCWPSTDSCQAQSLSGSWGPVSPSTTLECHRGPQARPEASDDNHPLDTSSLDISGILNSLQEEFYDKRKNYFSGL